MPELDRRGLAANPGRHHLYVVRDEPADGDVVCRCPYGGDWQTVRPEPAAWSAVEAHRTNHRKGMTNCVLPDD